MLLIFRIFVEKKCIAKQQLQKGMDANIHLSLLISFNIILILKPGFYELVFRSKLETAKIFREWVLYLITFLSLDQFYISYCFYFLYSLLLLKVSLYLCKFSNSSK